MWAVSRRHAATVGARSGASGDDEGVTTVNPPVFVYDGDCAFCSTCARFILRHVVKAESRTRVTAWQFADLKALGLTEAECDTAVQWVDDDGHGTRVKAAGPAAIAALLRTSGGLWRGLGGLLETRPGLALAWPVYRWIARHRDQMPGGTAACALPQAERNRLRATGGADARRVTGVKVGG
jgi:predicted DCC family thiol-disulfide oxidoreductase YuxK